MKLFLIVSLVTLAHAESHRRQKRDVTSTVNDALSLYYYGQNYTVPTITLNTTGTYGCGFEGMYGFYMKDIIGKAGNIADYFACMTACTNLAACVAVNYIPSTKQCYALKSSTSDSSQILWVPDVYDALHLAFSDCPSKVPSPAPTPIGGSAPAGCGVPYFQQNLFATVKTRIIGGTEAIPYSYPWIGKLTLTLGDGSTGNCGASLIMGSSSTESDLVITAAHCVTDRSTSTIYDPAQFTIAFGSHDTTFPEQQEQQRTVKTYKFHPGYTTNDKPDIAVLKLQTPVKFNNYIMPICLPSQGQLPKDKNTCVAAGWGRIANSNNTVATRVQQIKYAVQDDAVCGSSTNWGATFDKTYMTCAGPLDGSVSTCQGDSGGPLACFEDGHWVLYGATSFGNGAKVNGFVQCAAANRPGVFARISGLRTWIDQTIAAVNAA